MMTRLLLELRSSWAQSLALLNPVEEDKVALLLQLCSHQPALDADSATPVLLSVREAAANILPLISFVDKSGGQWVDRIMPEVTHQLPLLATQWAVPVPDPDSLERLFEDVFTSLRSVLRNEDVQAHWRQVLGAAVGELLTRLVRAVLRMPEEQPAATPAAAGPAPAAAPLPPAAPAQIMLRTLTRSQAFAACSGLPLLPAEAESTLTWMRESVLPPGGRVPMSGPAVPAPGSRAAIAAAAAGDEKLLLLMAQLARTMLTPQQNSVRTAGVSVSNGTADAAGANGAAEAAAAKQLEKERSLLTAVLTWSTGLVRSVLTKLLQPATGIESLSSALLTGRQQPTAAVPQPSAGVTRAAARLAATAMHGLLLRSNIDAAGGGSAIATPALGVLSAAARAQLMDVISMLLDMSEACVSAALEIGPQVAASDRMLDTAAYILEDCSSLIITAAREAATSVNAASSNGGAAAKPGAAIPLDVGTVFSRLKAILLAAAALVGRDTGAGAATSSGGVSAGVGWRSFWAWDVNLPLTASYARGTRMPGWGAQRLCCNVAEALTCGLAASYHAGVQAYVQALLLLPLSLQDAAAAATTSSAAPANEALVLSLAMGRLFVLLRGDEPLARSMVPLLTDGLAHPATSPAVVSLQASVVQTLAAIAASSVVSERSITWAYNQVTDVLLRLLMDARHEGTAAAVLAAGASGPGAGALCAGLLALAKGMRGAVAVVRRDLRNRLLVQFGELGMRVGGPDHDAIVAEMGLLLPAVAEACEGLEGSAFSLSASRFSLGDLAAQQRNNTAKTDVQMVKLLRNLWLYCALFGLSRDETAPPEQLAAAGRIAAWTPMLLLAEMATNEVDMAEQLKAELGDRLRLSGPAAAPARLRALLQSTLGIPVGGTPQPPPDANKQAYLLTIATAELCRAKYAPLKADVESSPISVPLTYLQSADPGAADMAWYSAIADKAFEVYLVRLKAEASDISPDSAAVPPVTSGNTDFDHRRASSYPSGRGPSYAGLSFISRLPVMEGTPVSAVGLAWPGEIPEDNGGEDDAAGGRATTHVSERCLEGLAVALIRCLGAAGGHAEGVAPQAATVASRLLKNMLEAYSPVYWSYPCVEALLSELETEEGLDHPLSEVHGANNLSSTSGGSAAAIAAPGTGGSVWRWLHAWIYAAATAAPTRTEALLHLFLGQSSIAAYTLGGDGALGGAIAAASASAPSGPQRRAHVAALRRAADLLAICADARRRAAVGAGAGVAADATMALCRKLFFSGVIMGVQFTTGGPTAGPAAVAELALSGLEEGLAAARHNVRLLEQRYLGAAAFLAREAAEEALAGSTAHSVCYRVLQGLCTAPLRRFTPDMMGLAVFAWTWITTSGPGWLVPLVSRTAAAWAVTVDRGLGLFSGPWGAHTHGSSAAAASNAGGADDGGEGDGPGGAARVDGGSSVRESSLLAALWCHHQWVAFMYEMWSSAGDRTDAERRAMASVYDRMLHHSLMRAEGLCSHPAAAAPLFRLLQLALAYCVHCAQRRPQGAPCPPAQALLYDRVLRAGLLWFAHPPGFSAHMSQRQAEEQHAAVSDFEALLGSTRALPTTVAEPVYDKDKHGPSELDAAIWSTRPPVSEAVWGPGARGLRAEDAAELLAVLCHSEVARLRVWARPLAPHNQSGAPALVLKEAHVKTAWKVSPQLAVAIVQRCPAHASGASEPGRALESLLVASAADPRIQALPEAAMVLATPEAARANAPYLAALTTWAPAGAVHGLQLMCGPAQLHSGVKTYALRCLHAATPAKVVFFLPQLVQALRNDSDGATARYLLDTAAEDDLFAHQLVWALATEERPPQEAFSPEVKRSGWQPPKETGLWDVAAQLKARALSGMTPDSAAYWREEERYFDQITSISGILKKLEPDERRPKIRRELQGFEPSRSDLYVPTNPDCRVIAHIPESGMPMQSAAKVPILVAFKVEQQQAPPMPPVNRTLACIFKVGDDVRQDVLALQVVSILRDAFQATGLDLYLRPYGCIPTGYERGVIEVVPHTKSRAALGELSDRGLHEIFVSQFGPPGTPAFETARHNFITSQAAYAVASFLLQAKDRHNGNLLIDSEGHLVHIDFGFILEISPGGNMGFESAAFKLSHEMTQLLDPGGMRNSGHFRLFEELCVRGYLVARTVAEPIIATVGLMADSGLPCFGHGKPLINLRKRFHLEMTEAQAAAFMRTAITDAYQKWTTGFYDYIQNLQNRIPY